ncbi:hypothetical protein UP09_05445 [Bradyrhizobium sp. LTSP885]|uniref:sulfurtransferase n=1 Tax=Bradyrhizobium sp. LTSP885 TaxID=1619232 RepID=UPI0005CA5B20|nr:sulfurtransferase [Bradyrhizobium sp. LTSP885]KJC50456.1 hypothetical protein UP09_05445 [Bradyrhizobium sp. LTSP885]
MMEQFLIEAKWLADRLDDKNLRILDCTTHLIADPITVYRKVSGLEDFEKGHIPGAQFVDVQADLSDNEQKISFMMGKPNRIAEAVARLGIDHSTQVVLYSTSMMWWATRVWWVLRTLGFNNAAVLDGGLSKWRAENHPIETGGARSVTPRAVSPLDLRALMVDKNDVLAAIGDKEVCTLNALAPPHHAGKEGAPGFVYGRPGHIKGSLNVSAASLVDSATNTLRSAEQLRKMIETTGAFDGRVIAYCGSGISASLLAFVLVMLGHPDVSLYDASLTEWAPDANLPMETGENSLPTR